MRNDDGTVGLFGAGGVTVGVPTVGVPTGGRTGDEAGGVYEGGSDNVVFGQLHVLMVRGRTIAAIARAATTRIPSTRHLCRARATLGSSSGSSA